jgi:deoxyribose-phosphate aldolase
MRAEYRTDASVTRRIQTARNPIYTAPMPSPTIDAVMLEQRAAALATRSIKTDAKARGLRLAMSMVDLTTLDGKDSPEKVRALCRKAIRPYEVEIDPPLPCVAAVCVYPALVEIAEQALAGSSVRVASVATAFPSGQYPLAVRLNDVRRAVAAGADEIDMVINRGAFLSGRQDVVAHEIRETKQACERAHLKIILETGELETYDNVRRAADLAIDAACAGPSDVEDGSVFIKTSTGKIAPAATLPVTLLMLEAIRDHYRTTGIRIGMKPAGGIRTAKQALHYLVLVKETLGGAWLSPKLFRIGASSLLNDLIRQVLRQERGRYAAAYDVSET